MSDKNAQSRMSGMYCHNCSHMTMHSGKNATLPVAKAPTGGKRSRGKPDKNSQQDAANIRIVQTPASNIDLDTTQALVSD